MMVVWLVLVIGAIQAKFRGEGVQLLLVISAQVTPFRPRATFPDSVVKQRINVYRHRDPHFPVVVCAALTTGFHA